MNDDDLREVEADASNMDGDEIDEICRSTPPTSLQPTLGKNLYKGGHCEINELRGRLDRRNALLDVIRKAYHRDVLVIKECLIDAQKQGLVANVGNAEEAFIGSSLESVPSIDLRKTFRLFSPQECELRVHPCWSCGGQLEVIHRESARIVNFKHSIQLLGENEKALRLELVDAKVKAQEDRERLADVIEMSRDERSVLLEQIFSLKHQVSDRNALDREVRQLKTDKKSLETTLERQKPILLDHKRLVVEIEEVRDDAKQWKGKFHGQEEQNRQLHREKDLVEDHLNQLNRENEQLQQDLLEAKELCKKSEDQCSTLTHDLSKSKAATKEIEACLHKAEQAIDELESEFEQEKLQMKGRIDDLESKCSDFQAKVEDLEERSRRSAEEAECYRKKIGATLEGARRRGSIAFVPQNSDAAFAKTDELVCELEKSRQNEAMLFNLLLSCIRSTYEKCLVQERILADNGSKLYRNNKKIKLSLSEPTNSKARMVLEHLGNADESDVIKWATILKDGTDQRHILGNLQNRMQMGQFSLDKAFQNIHKSHAAELVKCQDEHNKQMEERRSRIWELEKMLTEAIGVNRKYEDKMINMRDKYDSMEQKITSIQCILRKMRRECLQNNDIMSKLKGDYKAISSLVTTLLAKLRASEEEICAQKDSLDERQEDICNRDTAIEQLEALLESITHKYAENERLRIKETKCSEIQAVARMADASSQADFLPTPLRGITSSESENKRPSNALLPGRILTITDDNWPSRINVGPIKPVQYRRAIDNL